MEKTEEIKEEKVTPVSLGQIATQHELVYVTPQGNMTHEEYLVWIGNMLVEIKESLKG